MCLHDHISVSKFQRSAFNGFIKSASAFIQVMSADMFAAGGCPSFASRRVPKILINFHHVFDFSADSFLVVSNYCAEELNALH